MSGEGRPGAVPEGGAAADDARRTTEPSGDRVGREPGDLVVALSPRQIFGGFALLAALIVWLARRGRAKH